MRPIQILKNLKDCNSLDREYIKMLQNIKENHIKQFKEKQLIHLAIILGKKLCRLSSIKMKEKNMTTTKGVKKSIKEYSLDIKLDIFLNISK